MSFTCDYSDVDEDSKYFGEELLEVKKKIKCDECHSTIQPGEKYHKHSWGYLKDDIDRDDEDFDDGDESNYENFSHYDLCERCDELFDLLQQAGGCPYYGNLWEGFKEFLDEFLPYNPNRKITDWWTKESQEQSRMAYRLKIKFWWPEARKEIRKYKGSK